MTRHEKVLRIGETGRNILANSFDGNADRIMTILEQQDCDTIKISLQMELKKTSGDKVDGVGAVKFCSPSITINQTMKYKDEYDDVLLDFVNDNLPGFDDAKTDASSEDHDVKTIEGKVLDFPLLTSGYGDGEPEEKPAKKRGRRKKKSDEELFQLAYIWYHNPENFKDGEQMRDVGGLINELSIDWNTAVDLYRRVMKAGPGLTFKTA